MTIETGRLVHLETCWKLAFAGDIRIVLVTVVGGIPREFALRVNGVFPSRLVVAGQTNDIVGLVEGLAWIAQLEPVQPQKLDIFTQRWRRLDDMRVVAGRTLDLARTTGGWQYVGGGLIVAHFALPFALLLMRRNKDDIARLARVAMWILAIRWVEVLYQVKPAFSPASLTVHWMDIALLFGIGGIWLAFFTRMLASAALLPKNDPRVLRKLGAAEAH